ncbi:MAG: FAD-binding oxidoreductase [Acidimicrobiales bacterium]
MSRRAFLRAVAGAAAGVAVGGNAGVRWPRPSPLRASRAREALDQARAVPWRRLAGSMAGNLVLPDSPSFTADSQLFNERFDALRPAAIAYCASPADVQRCVEFARRHRVQVAARSGGHSYGGYSLCSGLVVDVTPMSDVDLDTTGTRATIGAGARMIDIYAALGNAGRLLPGGSCPTVGIAGLTLGGGVSVFSRRYGLTCDQLAALRIVTADGRLLTFDRERHDDLFWACRGGGGGNFGIVTSFEFRVHRIPPISLFTLQWPWAAAADVLCAWLRWSAEAPDDLWSNCQLLSAGSAGGTFSKVTGVFCGSAATLTSILGSLRRAVATAPTVDVSGPESYLPAMLVEAGCEGRSVAACHLPTQDPAGTLSRSTSFAKSAYLAAVPPDGGIAAAADAVTALDQEVPSVGGGLVFDAYGGAVNRVAPDATAFVHRDALACAQWSFSSEPWAPQSVVAAGNAWLASTGRALSPYVHGAYQNYIDPTLADWAEAYYGANLPRLVRVKRRVDPDDFFQFAQSVPTALV